MTDKPQGSSDSPPADWTSPRIEPAQRSLTSTGAPLSPGDRELLSSMERLIPYMDLAGRPPLTSHPGLSSVFRQHASATSRTSPQVHESIPHEIHTSMGAAPGIDGAEPIARPKDLFERRGLLAILAPQTCAQWTTSKWATQLDLGPFDPADEWEMENWFAKNMNKVLANQIPARQLASVMM